MNQYNSPLQSLYNWEDKIPNKIYLQQPINGVYYNWTWKEFGDEVRRVAS